MWLVVDQQWRMHTIPALIKFKLRIIKRKGRHFAAELPQK